MAFNFPNAPTTGQQYTPAGGPVYVYNGYGWTWSALGVPPVTVVDGSLDFSQPSQSGLLALLMEDI